MRDTPALFPQISKLEVVRLEEILYNRYVELLSAAVGGGLQENEAENIITMTANDIRNIALLGHGGSGKTSLAEQMLFMTKGTDRLGKTADGNTTCDYDAEEIKRQISISWPLPPCSIRARRSTSWTPPATSISPARPCAPSAPPSAPSSWATPRTACPWVWSVPGRCWARSPG